jgi:hypothetical protein
MRDLVVVFALVTAHLLPVLALVGVLVVAVIVAWPTVDGATTGLGERLCAQRWAASGYAFQYERLAGCKLLIDGRWVPAANVRITP